MRHNEVSGVIVDAAYQLHQNWGLACSNRFMKSC